MWLRAQNRFALLLDLLYTSAMLPEQTGCFGPEEGTIFAQGIA
jgi:hypothetical protein